MQGGGERMWERERKKFTEKNLQKERLIILEVNSYCTQEGTQDFGGYFFIGKKHFRSLKSLFSKLQVALQWGVSTLISFNFLTSTFFLISIPLLWFKSPFECDEAVCRALSLCQSSFSAFRCYVLVCFSVIGVLNEGLCFSHAKLPGQTASRRPSEKQTVMIPISSTIPPPHTTGTDTREGCKWAG